MREENVFAEERILKSTNLLDLGAKAGRIGARRGPLFVGEVSGEMPWLALALALGPNGDTLEIPVASRATHCFLFWACP
jgi:hypothetical protein